MTAPLFSARLPSRSPLNRRRLALEIGVVLAIKALALYLIWAAWFSEPAAKHMQMPPEEVARQVLAVPSFSSSLAAQPDAKHPSE